MELCCQSFIAPQNSNAIRTIHSIQSRNNVTVKSNLISCINRPSNSLKLLSFNSHIQLIQFQATPHLRIRDPFAVSASTSVASETEEDRLPADLIVKETPEPNSRVRLLVEVPEVVCEDCQKGVMLEFLKYAKVPGFRPGQAVPDNILINYVGKKNVQKATVEAILKRTLPHALSSVKGRSLQDSVRIATKFSDIEDTYASEKSLRYDVVVDVIPELKWIPENGYKNLKIVVEMDSELCAAKASQVELRRRHKSIGVLKIVTDRGLEIGDVAVLDISATTIDQFEKKVQNIPSAETKGFHCDTEDGDKLVPGFVDSIIGIRPGETKSFPLVFPETWKQENLQGIHAQFTVECKELFYRELPELGDSIAEKLVPGCQTLKEVKELLLKRCQEVEQTAKDQATDNAILDELCKMVEVDIPQSLFEEQGRQLYGANLLEIQAKMNLNEQQLASLSSQKAVNEYLVHQKDNIMNVIKQNLAVGDIFRRENLEFSSDELVKELENSIREFERHKQEYDGERVKDQVQEILEGAKVLEWLKEHADIKYIVR